MVSSEYMSMDDIDEKKDAALIDEVLREMYDVLIELG